MHKKGQIGRVILNEHPGAPHAAPASQGMYPSYPIPMNINPEAIPQVQVRALGTGARTLAVVETHVSTPQPFMSPYLMSIPIERPQPFSGNHRDYREAKVRIIKYDHVLRAADGVLPEPQRVQAL